MIGIISSVILLIVAVSLRSGTPKQQRFNLQKRTRLIAAQCIIGYLWALVGLAIIISPTIKKFGTWMPALFGVFISLKFISYVGVWHMKKWGVELMILAYAFEIALGFSLDYLSITNIVLAILSLSLFIPYYKRMDANL